MCTLSGPGHRAVKVTDADIGKAFPVLEMQVSFCPDGSVKVCVIEYEVCVCKRWPLASTVVGQSRLKLGVSLPVRLCNIKTFALQVALRIHRCGAVKVEVGDTGKGFLIFSGYMNV